MPKTRREPRDGPAAALAALAGTALALTDLVNPQVADTNAAWRAYLTLAALDLVRPGSMPRIISPDARGAALLTPEEIATADGVRQFLADLANIPGDTTPAARSAR